MRETAIRVNKRARGTKYLGGLVPLARLGALLVATTLACDSEPASDPDPATGPVIGSVMADGKTIEIRSAFVFESTQPGEEAFVFIATPVGGVSCDDLGTTSYNSLSLDPAAHDLPILAGAILFQSDMIDIAVSEPANCGQNGCGIDYDADGYRVRMAFADHCTTDPAVIDLDGLAAVSGETIRLTCPTTSDSGSTTVSALDVPLTICR